MGHGCRHGHTPAECWCCGRVAPRHGRGLCCRCYSRWQRRGFTGPGPGPESAAAAGRAHDHATLITALTARQAADRLGVSYRTVQRWRAILRRTGALT